MTKAYQIKHFRGKIKNTGTPLDGRILILSQWWYDRQRCFHLDRWDAKDDEAVMLAMHAADIYCLEMSIGEFRELWNAQLYEPEGSFILDLNSVEVIEELSAADIKTVSTERIAS